MLSVRIIARYPISSALLGWGLSLALGMGQAVMLAVPGYASEPYREFIDKLRDERLYDLALDYLDDLQKNKLADEAFTIEIPLERARLYQESAAGMGLRSPQRATRLDDAERAFNSFLEVNKNHPRRSEARLGLGNLLLARAEEARQQGDPAAAKPEAVKFYGQAQQLFEASLKELGDILTQMKGARIDANDEVKKQQREKFRDDYRRAELLLAFATENRGRSQAKGSPEWKADLEKAQTQYTELYMHEKERLEARNYALFYRSGIQRDFGKVDDAVDGYSRIASEGIDELRPLQFKAVTEIIKLWCSKGQNKFPAGLDLAAKWDKQLRPDERNTQDAIDLLLAAAIAKVEYAEVLQAKDADDRGIGKLRRDARDSLQKLSRINGSHQQAAREWMSKLGVSKEKSQEPVELPKVKNFTEATKEAADRIEQMRDEAVAQQSLLESLDKASDAQQKKELGDQLAVVNGNLDRIRDQAAELLRAALRMFPPGGEVEELNDARYRLAFVELQRGNPWEAIAIGEFLAQANAGSDSGLQCATVALAGFGKLISEADAEVQKTIADQLQPFAEFMVKTWPNSSEAQAAASTLVQLAMSAGDFAKAQSYLDKLPSGAGKADKLRRDIGLVLASQYFQDKAKLAEGTEVSAELNAKRDAALQQLTLALKDLKKEDLDSRTIEAINALVRLQLVTGKLTEATQWMTNRDLAPVYAIAANPDLVTERLVKLDSYRTALQATVSRLGDGQGSSDLLKQIEQLIAELQKSAGDDSEGKQLLTSIFVKVARDLQDLVQNADSTEKKQKLADGLVLLAQQIAGSSPDFSTKMWAGQTLNKVASVLDDSAKSTRVKLYKESVAILQSVLDKEAKSPGWITTPNGDILVRITLAKNLRQSGDYQAAVDLLAQVLVKNASMLDVQMEAAEILQAWGDSGVAEKYDLAINGAGSDGKGGKPIWGWAKLARALDRKPALAEQFFQCRYQLAVCLMRSGLAQSDAQKKTLALGRAEREIGATVLLYPTLGGEANMKRFDTLLKSIQKSLNKDPVGITKDPAKSK